MKIKITKRKEYLRIEKISKTEFIIRTLIFFLVVLYFFITSFIKYGILTIGMSIFCLPVIFLFYLRFILKCSYEILIIKKNSIRFYISKNYYINKSKFKNLNKKFEIFNLEKIYFKEYPIQTIVRGVKYQESPYFKLHFIFKDEKYADFGLMLDNNKAKEILKEIRNFLNMNYTNM
ncbi:organic solvent tolerance protein [Fusobacterium polymorphum]|uniref:organic solvent tolerance protein n=1 Tax=Fusobacterium nucleatum subsp. polymorphum TaxID=76857 RepID=UPI00300B4319